MKKRISRVLNFLAFNLLFFALYLNFIHKDTNAQAMPSPKTTTVSSKGTVLVEHPEQYLNKNTIKHNGTTTAELQN